MGFFVNLVIAIASALLSTALRAKPQRETEGRTVDRRGVDQPLDRMYGTRRLSMIVTDAIVSNEFYSPAAFGGDTATIRSWGFTRNGQTSATGLGTKAIMYTEGPLAVAGRLNAQFQLHASKDDYNFLVNEKPYDSKENRTAQGYSPSSAGGQVYHNGGTRSAVAAQGELGATNNVFTKQVHAAGVFALAIRRKIVFSQIPTASWDMKSNLLWDPRNDAQGDINTPANWTGREDNAGLQLLDYLLDVDFGPGIDYAEINEASFELMANIADVPVGVEKTTDSYSMYPDDSFGFGGGFFGGFYGFNLKTTTVTVTPRELIRSNVLLDTGKDTDVNVEELLAACRGARLFRDLNGLIKVNPAWIHEDDIDQTITGVTGTGPFTLRFNTSAITVTKNGLPLTVTTDYTVTTSATLTSQTGYSFGTGENDGPADSGTDPSTVIGISFTAALIVSDNIVISFTNVPSLSTVMHIVMRPEDLGLDYDATQDTDSLRLARVQGDEAELEYVGFNDRFNQCIVSFPDEDQNYKQNQAIWPEEGSSTHTAFLSADNTKRFIEKVDINSITEMGDALDYAQSVVRQSRSSDQIRLLVDYVAIQLEPNDIFKVSIPELNENGTLWRCVERQIENNLQVKVVGIRYDIEDYTYIDEAYAITKVDNLLYDEAAVTSISFTATDPTGLLTTGRLSWTAPARTVVGEYAVDISEVGVWSSSVAYVINDVVYHAGEHWIATGSSTNSEPDYTNSDWQLDEIDQYWNEISRTPATATGTPLLYTSRTYAFRITPISPLLFAGESAYFTTTVNRVELGAFQSYITPGYGSFEGLPDDSSTYIGDSHGTVASNRAFNTSIKYVGTRSLALTGVAGGVGFYSNGPSTEYGMPLPPGRRWLLMARIRATATTGSWSGQLIEEGATTYSAASAVTLNAANTWQQVVQEIDATASTLTAWQYRIFNASFTSGAQTAYVDAVALIDVTEHPQITQSNFPSAWFPATGWYEASATAGAQVGVNLTDSNGALLTDTQVDNQYSAPARTMDPNVNRFMTLVDSTSDRPLGIRAHHGSALAKMISFDNDDPSTGIMRLYDPDEVDSDIGAAWPAFPVQFGEEWRVTLKWRVVGPASAPSSGLYFRFTAKQGPIDQGKTHIMWSVGETVGDIGAADPHFSRNTNVVFDENGVTVGDTYNDRGVTALNTWYTTTVRYRPQQDDEWASFSVLNWTGLGADASFEVDHCVLFHIPRAIFGLSVFQDDGNTAVPVGGVVRATANPPAIVWDTYEAGGWSPAETNRSATVEFWIGDTVIATRVLDATLDDSGADEGDINVVAGTSSGDATTVTISNNDSPVVSVLVEHNDTGVEIDVQFAATLPGYSGGPSK